ncbi:MAG TPA: hypothetical protein VKU90_12275 [Caulobacteraceae bacterium]|nr:hypothetical protein [Caulobacteraceae bacterium]
MPSVAVIIQNYKRPQNIGLVTRNAREALPEAPIFLLDQAADASLRDRNDIAWDEVWYRKADNRGAGARFPIAAAAPFDHYIAIDDDTFLTPPQIAALAERLAAEPDRAHGVWGQRVELEAGRLSFRSDLCNINAALSFLNLAYAFSRAQALGALALAAQLGFPAWPDNDPIDDMLMSCGLVKPPLCHDLGPLAFCPTSTEPGVATWREQDFSRRRREIAAQLIGLGRVAVFSPLVIR